MSATPLVQVDQSLRDLRGDAVVTLERDQHHHLTGVLRLRPGDAVEVTDGAGGHAHGRLTADGLELVSTPTHEPAPSPALRVVHGLPKGRKLDEVVRVLTELGVDELRPVAAARSVRRPEGERAERAVARWRAVARAAGEQARRRHRLRVAPIASVADLEVDDGWLVAHPRAETGLPQRLARLGAALEAGELSAVTMVVGPEGGWSDDEVDRLVAAGAHAVHLGASVLRTEHAAAAATAVCSAWLGRWGPLQG
jgi:16S rRNA (uracil1498-N3)-methyltransferase